MNHFSFLFKDFFSLVASGTIDIYNEFSVQHELGFYLRSSLPSIYSIQFERPTSFFGINRSAFLKKEIDIVIFSSNQSEKIAIELKYPRNGQYPEQMFKACEDICFIEQLNAAGFSKGFFIMVADDSGFYARKQKNDGIYQFFRMSKPLHGTIRKPTGKKDQSFQINGNYPLTWNTVKNKIKYTMVTIG